MRVFDYEIDLDRVAMTVETTVRKYTRILSDMGFTVGIDEIALLAPNQLMMLRTSMALVTLPGVVMNNSATDHVDVKPIHSCYSVDYAFFTGFTIDEVQPYRIELMHLNTGFSPLHNAILGSLQTDHGLPVVHASFKVQDEENYAAALHRLRQNSMECVQRCDSAYGKFSYWQPLEANQDTEDAFVLLKPRVNLRDVVVPS